MTGPEIDRTQPLLSCRGVSVDYVTGAVMARACNRISLDIHPGETVGLAGESGCGKSTLAFAITRMHAIPGLVSEGEILFEGRDVLKMDAEELRKFRWNETSMVFQSAMNALNPVITIGEQLTDVVQAHEKVSLAEARTRGEELLETVGISRTRMSSDRHQLSGGCVSVWSSPSRSSCGRNASSWTSKKRRWMCWSNARSWMSFTGSRSGSALRSCSSRTTSA